jgi:hypothetical protein
MDPRPCSVIDPRNARVTAKTWSRLIRYMASHDSGVDEPNRTSGR